MPPMTKAQLLARAERLQRSLKRETAKRKDLERALKDSVEQQTAAAEILRIIGRSPTDLQPVFDAIVESAARLCDARFTALYRYDGDLVHIAAHHNLTPEVLAVLQRLYPMRPAHEQASGRAILGAAVVHLPDVLADSEYRHEVAIAGGWASLLAVPMMREGRAVGTINIYRGQAEPFPENQIELLKTFADQAVIAIENVRLFKELEVRNRDVTEALEQQTATSEILRAISSTPTDVQPVFDAIAESSVRLCNAFTSSVFRFDGELLHFIAQSNFTPEALEVNRRLFPAPLNRDTAAARAIFERAIVHIPDVLKDPEFRSPEWASALGIRSVLSVPMLHEGRPIGVIAVTRVEVGPFSDPQISLLQTFADQAVIAVENVRLFTELQEKNRSLTAAHAQVTEALEQQTATAEILRVISSSQTDVQPVFDTIVRNAVRLCDGLFSALFQFDGELLHLVAQHNYTPEALEAARRIYPARPSRAHGSARAILDRAVVHIPDNEVDPEFQNQAVSRAIGWRSGLFVPMLREGAPIGVIMVARAEPGPFSNNEIELLKTFADQGVIAVENVRLFKELQARTGELTRSVEQLTALGEISRAVSSTLDVETVLATIVSRATQLAGADGCAISEYDDATELFHVRATHGIDAALIETLRAMPLRKGEGVGGRATEMREPIQIADIAVPGAYQSHLRDVLIEAGFRAVLSVPCSAKSRSSVVYP
jgi:two-component system, NtrC family, sensor kinase